MTYDVPIASETTSQEIKTIAKDIKQKVTNNTGWNGNGDTYTWQLHVNVNTKTYEENSLYTPNNYYIKLQANNYNYSGALNRYGNYYGRSITVPKAVTHLVAQIYVKEIGGYTFDFQLESSATAAADRYMPVTEEFVIDLRNNVTNVIYITKDFYLPRGKVDTFRDYNSMAKSTVTRDIYSFEHCDTQFLKWLLELHRAGKIDLWNYWKLGNRRELVLTDNDGTTYGKFSLVLCSNHYSDYITHGEYDGGGHSCCNAKPIFAFITGMSVSFASPFVEPGETLYDFYQNYIYRIFSHTTNGWGYKRVGIDDYDYNGAKPQFKLIQFSKPFRVLSYDSSHALIQDRNVYAAPPLQEEITGINPDGKAAGHNVMMLPYNGSPMLWTREIKDSAHVYATNGEYTVSDDASSLNRPGYIIQLA